MKHITKKLSILIILAALTACGGNATDSITNNNGGGGGTSNPTPNNPNSTPSPGDDLGDLVIDNGRGTTNNQDTEQPRN